MSLRSSGLRLLRVKDARQKRLEEGRPLEGNFVARDFVELMFPRTGSRSTQMDLSILRWTTLRSIGNLRVVQLTILVPVIGYFILFNDELVQNLEFSNQVIPRADQHAGLSTGTLLKLMSLYFGLCLIAVGSALFSVFCPRLIRRYQDFAEYAATEIDLLTDRHIAEINSRLEAEGECRENVFDEIETALAELLDQFHYSDAPLGVGQTGEHVGQRIEDLRRRRKANLANLLDRQFVGDDQRFLVARAVVSASFIFGGVLVSVPAATMFVQVSHRAFQLIGSVISLM